MAHDLVTELLQDSSLACFMPIWQLCANLLIPNCLRSNLSYSPLAALELYVSIADALKAGMKLLLENIKVQEATDSNEQYYISPTIKALETGFKCPDNLSEDYKQEWSDTLTEKHL